MHACMDDTFLTPALTLELDVQGEQGEPPLRRRRPLSAARDASHHTGVTSKHTRSQKRRPRLELLFGGFLSLRLLLGGAAALVGRAAVPHPTQNALSLSPSTSIRESLDCSPRKEKGSARSTRAVQTAGPTLCPPFTPSPRPSLGTRVVHA